MVKLGHRSGFPAVSFGGDVNQEQSHDASDAKILQFLLLHNRKTNKKHLE